MGAPRTTINEATKHCQNAGEYLSYFARKLSLTAASHFGDETPERQAAEDLQRRAVALTADFAKFRVEHILTAKAKS